MIPEGLPARTLGWGVLQWGSKYLAQPDRAQGEPWVYTNEQAKFILWYYAVSESGEFIYRRSMLSRPKGWGKSPLLAALCCTELLGPVEFSHFDKDGKAVGKSRTMAYIQIVATAYEQTENTMALVSEMLCQGTAKDHYELDVTLTRVRAPGGGKIERVTAASKSKEGQRPTFAVLDETHLWDDSNGGPALAAVIRRNLMKYEGRSVETTNAPVPGKGSVAELTDEAWARIQEGLADPDLLYDNAEEFCADIYDREEAWPILERMYGDSMKSRGGWISLDRVWSEINDPATREEDARRFYFNQRVHSGSQWIHKDAWKGLEDRDLRPLSRDDRISVGFRGQARAGSTAIVAYRLSDSALFVLKNWEVEGEDESVPWGQVDAFMRHVLENYNVALSFIAPQNWQDVVARWYEAFEDKVEEFWTSNRNRMARATEQFETAARAHRLVHSGDQDLRRHVENAETEDTPSGVLIRKATKKSTKFISVAEAAILALAAGGMAIERGLETEEDPVGEIYSF